MLKVVPLLEPADGIPDVIQTLEALAGVVAAFAAGFVRFLVQQAALGREPVLGPLPFDVDERALPRAELEVLQRGDGEEIGRRFHHGIKSIPRP